MLTSWKGPVHFLVLARYTITGEPGGRRGRLVGCSDPFGSPERKQKSTWIRPCSRSISRIAALIAWAHEICVAERIGRTGGRITHNTRSIGQSPSGPILELTEKGAIFRHLASLA